MSRQLHTLFNLADPPEDDDSITDIDPAEDPMEFPTTLDTLDTINKIEAGLPAVRGLEASDDEMDELAKLAKNAFTDLVDLGMSTDPRFASEIFNSASSFLGHAITARSAKVNKKLKMLDLQLKKADLERKIANDAKKAEPLPGDETPLGTGQVIDRAELIRQVLAASKPAAGDK